MVLEDLLAAVHDAVEAAEAAHEPGWAQETYAKVGDHFTRAATVSHTDEVITHLRPRSEVAHQPIECALLGLPCTIDRHT